MLSSSARIRPASIVARLGRPLGSSTSSRSYCNNMLVLVRNPGATLPAVCSPPPPLSSSSWSRRPGPPGIQPEQSGNLPQHCGRPGTHHEGEGQQRGDHSRLPGEHHSVVQSREYGHTWCGRTLPALPPPPGCRRSRARGRAPSPPPPGGRFSSSRGAVMVFGTCAATIRSRIWFCICICRSSMILWFSAMNSCCLTICSSMARPTKLPITTAKGSPFTSQQLLYSAMDRWNGSSRIRTESIPLDPRQHYVHCAVAGTEWIS